VPDPDLDFNILLREARGEVSTRFEDRCVDPISRGHAQAQSDPCAEECLPSAARICSDEQRFANRLQNALAVFGDVMRN